MDTGSVSISSAFPQTEALSLTDSSGKTEDDALVRTCQEMESLFLYHLLKEMRTSIPDSGLSENKTARDMYMSMSDQYLANELAGRGGIGLAQVLFDRLEGGCFWGRSP